MDNLHLHILSLRDEVVENWNMVKDFFAEMMPKRHNSIGIAAGDLGPDSDGRVWVEVGGPGLRLMVMHLHPANPTVAEAVATRLSTDGQENQEENMISFPSEDEISLASQEDYWFNHWQGPYITADSNQNTVSIRRSRRSLRKSKRKFRCSVCQRKIVGVEDGHEELSEAPCYDGENVLAHVPSVKLETRSPKVEDPAATGSSDDEGVQPVNTEEALSRYSASDEQLARAYRVMDNELRTSFTLFAEEAVTQDVVDSVSMSVNDSMGSPDTSLRLAPPSHSPRQSRSCPCSPKLSGRNHSPKSNTDSPKPRSRSGSSKFSLSSSLMAIHRQASNTLRPDFLRFDSGKGESGGSNSKSGSHQNSLKNELKHSRSSVETHHNSFGESHLNSSNNGSLRGESSGQDMARNTLQESISLPALKLSRMSLTYKGGVIINEDRELSASHTSDTTKLILEGACALPPTPENETVPEGPTHPSMLLPDVIPRYEGPGLSLNQISESEASECSSPASPDEQGVSYHFDTKEGVINLGFDGHEESSDFSDFSEAINTRTTEMDADGAYKSRRRGSADSDIEIGKSNVHLNLSSVHGISIGHSSPGQDGAIALEVPNIMPDDQCQETGSSSTKSVCDASESSSSCPTTPPTASPSPAPRSSLNEHPSPGLRLSVADDLEEEEPTFDHMSQARQLVFWWQKANPNDDSEFCQNYTECKVKQKPLLLFLHGMGGSSDQWRQQLWYFVCCGYEVVAPDLIGHGLSSAPKEPSHYNFAQVLDHITLVFDVFVPQGRKCVIIGHGYGCSLAAALARGRPLSVRLLILASCGGPSPLMPSPPGKSLAYSYFAAFLSPFLACGCCSRDILYAPRGKHFASSALSGESVTPTPRYVLEYLAKGQKWPEGDVAFHRRITVPTLLLHGMKDDRVSLVEMCEMERTIPRAFLEMVPSGGHDLMTDAPLEVCHALHRFIKRWRQQL